MAGLEQAGAFRAETFYYENNWQEHPNSEAYREQSEARSSGAGRSDLLKRLDGRLREPLPQYHALRDH